jgi:hypothetical protein
MAWRQSTILFIIDFLINRTIGLVSEEGANLPELEPADRPLILLAFYYFLFLLSTFLVLSGENVAAQSIETSPSSSFNTYEFRYLSADAGAVDLVWGIDGWQVLPEMLRPQGTTVAQGNAVMSTPMSRDGGVFLVRLTIPQPRSIEYGFLIKETRQGKQISLWEDNEGKPFHIEASQDRTIRVISKLDLPIDKLHPFSSLAFFSAAVFLLLAYRSAAHENVTASICLILLTGLILRAAGATDSFLHPWDERYHALVAKNMLNASFEPMLYKDPALESNDRNWWSSHIWLHMLITLTPVNTFATLQKWGDRVIPKTCGSSVSDFRPPKPVANTGFNAGGQMASFARHARVRRRG